MYRTYQYIINIQARVSITELTVARPVAVNAGARVCGRATTRKLELSIASEIRSVGHFERGRGRENLTFLMKKRARDAASEQGREDGSKQAGREIEEMQEGKEIYGGRRGSIYNYFGGPEAIPRSRI
jgi:hypothetical protein